MGSLKEEAQSYKPKETKNIADLEKVSVNVEIETRVVKEGTPEEFSYLYFTQGEEEYRVPGGVLNQMKTLLDEKPDLEFVKVKKNGEGLKTTYMVIPM